MTNSHTMPRIGMRVGPLLVAAALAMAGALAALPAAAQDLARAEKKITVHTLPNGWTFIIYERPTAPVFSFSTYVNAGAAQEVPGITGLAHLFEHMAFKGTPNIGTKDYEVELWAYLESERFMHPVFREFYKERDVVKEERRLRTESSPQGRLMEQFTATAFTAHPYHQPVVGFISGLNSFSREGAERFYRTYYVPSNIVTAIVGDVKASELIPLLDKYFGRIPKSVPPPTVRTVEPPQTSEKVIRMPDPRDSSLCRDLAALLVKTGNPSEALVFVQRGLALKPDDPDLPKIREAAAARSL